MRAGAVRLEDDSFVKDGAAVHFQRVRLTRLTGRGTAGRERPRGCFTIAGDRSRPARRPKAKAEKTKAKKTRDDGRKARAKRPRVSSGASSASVASRGSVGRPSLASVVAKDLFEALRAWRLGEAQRVGIPAFRILHDRTLLGVATDAPRDEDALLRVAGIGPGLARRYGAALLGIVARYVNR